jgi:zinc protease
VGFSRKSAFVAVALSACTIAKFPPPAPPRQTNLGLDVSTTTLSNGLRVVLVTDPNAIDVQVTMRYQVGAVDDGAHPGMAHFVEHLMFQQIMDGEPLFTRFEDTAVGFNAYTSYDTTTYVSRAPAEQLGTLLSLEATRLALRCESIGDVAFAREREVVINEIKERDQVSEVYAAIHSALYPNGHPYQHSIGGSTQTVGAITREQACAFADGHYSPSNAVLVVSGKLGDSVRGALDKLAATAPARKANASAPVAALALRPIQLQVPAPIDDDVLVLAWPLPLDPALQVQVRAVAAALPRLVDGEIKGHVVGLEFGDARAPMFGLAVLPADDETFTDATLGTRRGIEKLPTLFGEGNELDDALFERIRQGAVYGLYSSLEDGSDRDGRLANYVLAGLDPMQAFRADLAAVRSMSRERGAAIAYQYFGVNTPTVVTLKASSGKKRGETLALRKPVHDMGQRRKAPDAALAARPADGALPPPYVGARTRVLPNGLKVVLLPMTSVPTIDVRLIFSAGTADEPLLQRGLATLTAQALSWDLHYLRDLVKFAAAGGMKGADVGTDRTTFSVQGTDSHIDVLLAGLRRWVRDGTFDDDSAKLVVEMRRAAKRTDDDGVLTDTWRAALFGATHPYVNAGIARHTSNALTLDDAAQFRALHYTPANATLVIAGHFDPLLADKWIDFLFADWLGAGTPRASAQTKLQPASIGRIDDLAMMQLRIAVPASASDRAHQLVAAAMLSEIARDVRFQLGAGYTVDAMLSEKRLARHYVIGGWVDASRSADAVRLIRDRVQQLRDDAGAAARAFVTARKHVIAQLLSRVGSAESLAARVEYDVEMEREPMSDLKTVAAVRALTIDAMAITLAELDLRRAAVLMRGPAADLQRAFDVLGRKPQYIKDAAATAVVPPSATAPLGTTAAPVYESQLAEALTDQPPPRIMVAAQLTTAFGAVSDGISSYGSTGNTVSLQVGYRYKRNRAIGARTSLGFLDGTNRDAMDVSHNFTLVPMVLGAFWTAGSKLWLTAGLGLRIERLSETPQFLTGATTTRWFAGVGYSLDIGFDVFTIGLHRLGIVVGADAMSFRTSDEGSFVLSLGVSYRR